MSIASCQRPPYLKAIQRYSNTVGSALPSHSPETAMTGAYVLSVLSSLSKYNTLPHCLQALRASMKVFFRPRTPVPGLANLRLLCFYLSLVNLAQVHTSTKAFNIMQDGVPSNSGFTEDPTEHLPQDVDRKLPGSILTGDSAYRLYRLSRQWHLGTSRHRPFEGFLIWNHFTLLSANRRYRRYQKDPESKLFLCVLDLSQELQACLPPQHAEQGEEKKEKKRPCSKPHCKHTRTLFPATYSPPLLHITSILFWNMTISRPFTVPIVFFPS